MTVPRRGFILGGLAAAAAPLIGSGKAWAAQTGPQGSPGRGADTQLARSDGAFSPATDPASWMTQNGLQNTPFSQITLYGSHDSGMSTLVEIGGSADAAISQAQSLPIYDQVVNGGVRYLDIRPAYWSGPDGAGWFIAHWSKVGSTQNYVGWLGISLSDAISEIANAAANLGDFDVLLVELSHGIALTDVDSGKEHLTSTWNNLHSDELSKVTSLFASDQKLGPLLYQLPKNYSSPNFWTLTPQVIHQPLQPVLPNGAKVFIFAGDDTATTTPTGPIFPKTSSAAYYNSWDDAQTASNPSTLISDLTTSLDNHLATPQPFLLSYHCTGAVDGSSLEELAAQLNPMLMDSLATWYSSEAISNSKNRVPVIVTADYISKTDLTMLDTSIGMNFGRWYGFLYGLPGGPQHCTQGPAMAWLNDVYYAAWAGTDSHHSLNIVGSTDPVLWGNPLQSQTAASQQSPALCASGDTLQIAWTGTDDSHTINFSALDVDGTTIHDIPTVHPKAQEADHGPALAWLDNTLYVAYAGTDDHHYLNVMWSTDNGQTFFPPKQTTEESADTPALCVLNNELWLAWKGTDNEGSLNIAPLQRNGVAVTGVGSTHQPGQNSQHGPAATVIGTTMYVAWVGTDYHGLNLITTTDGQTFTGHYASVQQSSATPAMCTDGTRLYFAWAGTDNSTSLNFRQFLLPGQTPE
jgi:hypothetical protein